MHYSTLIISAVLAKLALAGYTLETNYPINGFFNDWTFFTGTDPTAGYVNYVDQATATSDNLINTDNNQVYIGVGTAGVASSPGRNSVRITSTASYNHGLFILDLAHMPGGICGTWPAFWLVGPNWPNEGEIDIIEGVNVNANNAMTLHTSDGCSVTDDGDFTGTLTTSNCYIDAAGQSSNAGCDIQDQSTQSYGTGFNSNGGGVYATEWTSSDINIWFFSRGTTPSDITSGTPDPSTWGEPVAQFQGACDIDSHFQNLQIVFDTTFCGDWAGAVWSSTPACASLADTCNDYVQNNPSAFVDAYWTINSLNVYQDSADADASANATASDEVRQQIQANKNQTAPLASEPLAMGGGSAGVGGPSGLVSGGGRKRRGLGGRKRGIPVM